jgi:hypothetical protein
MIWIVDNITNDLKRTAGEDVTTFETDDDTFEQIIKEHWSN